MIENNSRYQNPSAGILLITRMHEGHEQILLQHRGNIKMLPNIWDCISGHVEAGESVRQSLVREAMEELGIKLSAESLKFVGLNHLKLDESTTYYNIFFTTDEFEGSPKILEPKKHDGLKWFNIASLESMSSEIVSNRYFAIMNLHEKPFYIEENFDSDTE